MDILRQPALGRTAELGTLYNIKEARFLSTPEYLKFSPEAFWFAERSGMFFRQVYPDTINEKFFKFGVPPELQLHILGQVFEVRGSGRYLHAGKSSARAVRVGLLCTVTTKIVALNMTHPQCWQLLNLAKFASPTDFVVTEITYGGMIVVTVEDRNEDGKDVSTVVQELHALLAPLTEALRQGQPVDQRDFPLKRNLSWTVYSDFVHRSVLCPTFQDVLNQFENLREAMKYQNRGLGIPIDYLMLPLQQCLNISNSLHGPRPSDCIRIPRIGADLTSFFVQVFDHISMIEQQANDLCSAVHQYRFCVTQEDIDLTKRLQEKCQAAYTEMWEALANALLISVDAVIELKQEFVAKYQLTNFDREISNLQCRHEKFKLLDVLVKKGVKYCNTRSSFDEAITNSLSADCYIFHYSTNAKLTQNKWTDNWNTFLKMCSDHHLRGSLFLFADNDFDENASTSTRVRICHLKDRKVVSKDMLEDCMGNVKTVCHNVDHCMASCSLRNSSEIASSHCPPDLTRSKSHVPESALNVASGITSGGLPKPYPIKQNADVRTPAVDSKSAMQKIPRTGIGRCSARDAERKTSNEVPLSAETRESASCISSVQESETKDGQKWCQANDRRRQDVKPCRPQKNKAEGQSVAPLSRQPVEQSFSKPETDSSRHGQQGPDINPSFSKVLSKNTNYTNFRSQNASLGDGHKTVAEVSKTFHKAGCYEDTNKEVQEKPGTAVKGVQINHTDSISATKKPSAEIGDMRNRAAAGKREQQACSEEREHKTKNDWTVVRGRGREYVGKSGRKTSDVQQTSTIVPLLGNPPGYNSDPQRKVEGQVTQPLARDVACFQKPRHRRAVSLQGPPKSSSDTYSRFTNENGSEGEPKADHLSGKWPPRGQFEDPVEDAQENSGKTINILILGESGVGKSTWINGVANYLAYSTVEEAARSKPVYVIDSSFLLTDDDYNEVVVSMGPDGDGKVKLGTSATQFSQSYTFSVGGRNVRLIDTPGVGDTRGVDKDQENFRNMFSYLSRLREIHGICVLLKPNSARMNTSFQFCIKELLGHLHKDASKNIAFVFTNSRGTFYRPGDTFPTLSSLLKENECTNIPLGNERVYCMDNEPVRFLAATKQGMLFTERDRENYSKSWEVSRAETNRLIAYVSSLEPHAVEKSLHLNKIMDVSIEAAEHIVAIAKDHQMEIFRSEKRHNEEKKPTQSGDEKRSQFGKMIVCCSTTCKRAGHQRGNSGTYSNVCHRPCKHNIQPNGVTGNDDIKECEVMTVENGICKSCGCSWFMHMCISCELGTELADKSRSRKYASAGKEPSGAERFLADLSAMQRFVLRTGAKLGIFLKQSTIGSSRDVILEQLERSIEREQELVVLGESSRGLSALTKVLKMYRTEVKSLEEEWQQKQRKITFSEIGRSFGKLPFASLWNDVKVTSC